MESGSKHTLMPYHNSYILFTKVNFGLVSTFVEGMVCPTMCLAVKGELGLKHLRQTLNFTFLCPVTFVAHIHFALPFLRGARVAQWWEHSPITNVVRFQIPASISYDGWVQVVVGSLLSSKRFFSGFLVFPSPQNPTLPNSSSDTFKRVKC